MNHDTEYSSATPCGLTSNTHIYRNLPHRSDDGVVGDQNLTTTLGAAAPANFATRRRRLSPSAYQRAKIVPSHSIEPMTRMIAAITLVFNLIPEWRCHRCPIQRVLLTCDVSLRSS
jgi:hypothetical protein